MSASSYFCRLLFFLILALSAGPVAAQTNTEVFGQNRVQYRTFKWAFFDTKHFRIYHYDRAGRSLARYVAEQAERDISSVEKKLSGSFPQRFNIVLYNQYDEYRQTNIGRRWDSQLRDVPTGTLNLVGDQLVVYFTGLHTDLRRQLRAGMARVVMERMLFGETAREMAKNAVNLNLPPWVADGFIAYLTDGWDAATDSRWKALLAAPQKWSYYLLAERDPELAGKAFWKWISDTKGEGEVNGLLRLMRMRGSVGRALKTVVGLKEKKAQDSCLAWYRQQYAVDSLVQEMPDRQTLVGRVPRPEGDARLHDVRVSPNGRDIAFTTWKQGVFTVYLQRTTTTGKPVVLLTEGRRDFNETTADPNYPIIRWSNDGLKLAILYQRNRKTVLRIYNTVTTQKPMYAIPENRFDRVLGMTFVGDNTKLVISAIKKSQTDLYEFRIRGSRLTPITNDVWDDLEPMYADGGFKKGLIFLSNRPAAHLVVPAEVNVLPTGPVNAFFYSTVTQSPQLLQLTRNDGAHPVSQPIQYGIDNYAVLQDSNGIRNQFVVLFGRDRVNMDSAYAVPATNLPQSIITHQYSHIHNRVYYSLEDSFGVAVYQKEVVIPGRDYPIPALPLTSLEASERRKSIQKPNRIAPAFPVPKAPTDTTARSAADAQIYQSEFAPEAPDSSQQATLAGTATPQPVFEGVDTTLLLNPLIKDSTYLNLKAQPYRLSFKPDFVTVRADNTILFSRYQSIAANGVGYTNPNLGGLVSVSLNDALENHRFTGGMRIPLNLKGGTYFLQYENFERRWDWGVLLFRSDEHYANEVVFVTPSGQTSPVLDYTNRVTTHIFQGKADYPFDRRRRIGLSAGIRLDQSRWKAADSLSLRYLPESKSTWGLLRTEYVYDNSISTALNVRQGLRYKVYAEGLMGLTQGNGAMYNFGFDLRHYEKVYRQVHLASRVSGAHSGGKQKILYFLGGVDNWLLPKNDVPAIGQEQYAFQALATNLRGYRQGARNGNSYVVANEELRIPIWNSFIKRPVKSLLLQNLQLVAFADAGMAWNGLFPTQENTRRSLLAQMPGNPVTVQLEIPNSGFALGYGAGLRTMLMGYFVRADFAWNIEGNPKPIFYLSFGTDF